LRAYRRTIQEENGNPIGLNVASPLIRDYYPNSENPLFTFSEYITKINDSITTWMLDVFFRIDEFRVVCGSNPKIADYMNGDDLSENVFRCALGLPMRFAYYKNVYHIDWPPGFHDKFMYNAITKCHSNALNCGKSICNKVNWTLREALHAT
jgi:hypothetical protein